VPHELGTGLSELSNVTQLPRKEMPLPKRENHFDFDFDFIEVDDDDDRAVNRSLIPSEFLRGWSQSRRRGGHFRCRRRRYQGGRGVQRCGDAVEQACYAATATAARLFKGRARCTNNTGLIR